MNPTQAFEEAKPLLSEVSRALEGFDLPPNARAGFAVLVATYFVTRAGMWIADYEGETGRVALDARSREALRLIEAAFDANPPKLRAVAGGRKTRPEPTP